MDSGVWNSHQFYIYCLWSNKRRGTFTITKGLVIFLDLKGFNTNVAVVDETIDEDKAVAWNTFQGTSVSFVFAGDMLDAEEIIKEVVLDGLKYLRYKNDYLGFYRSDSHV